MTKKYGQVKEALTIATRKMESEHERSLLISFPSLEDGTLGTTWTKGHLLHSGALSKPPELACSFSRSERGRQPRLGGHRRGGAESAPGPRLPSAWPGGPAPSPAESRRLRRPGLGVSPRAHGMLGKCPGGGHFVLSAPLWKRLFRLESGPRGGSGDLVAGPFRRWVLGLVGAAARRKHHDFGRAIVR